MNIVRDRGDHAQKQGDEFLICSVRKNIFPYVNFKECNETVVVRMLVD